MKFFNRYIYYFLFLSFLFSGNADHLIFNKIAITNQVQMIEIYNPLDSSVSLSNYYLSDQNDYYSWIEDGTLDGLTLGSRDFILKVPNNSIIESQNTFTITTFAFNKTHNYFYIIQLRLFCITIESINVSMNCILSYLLFYVAMAFIV